MPFFDYEEARLDVLDAGGDPDYLETNNPAERDEYLRKVGLNPKDYGGGITPPAKPGKPKSDDLCFLTTACMRAKNAPDDCEELTLMRAYRDGYLASRKDGRSEIETYYRIAPSVVKGINAREDAQEIWEKVYAEMILPCVECIRREDNEGAFTRYKAYTLSLAGQYAKAL